jgi:hypothetical protein
MPEPRARRRAGTRIGAGLLLALTALVPCGADLLAQPRGEAQLGRLPAEVTERVLTTWNAADTRRERGRTVIAAADTVRGALAVLDGPLVVAGVVLGDVVTINADVRLDSTAWIRGTLLTVGGGVTGRARGRVDGDLEVWRAALRWREEDGRLASDEEASLRDRYARWRDRGDVNWRDLLVTSAHTYNRVEGLAVLAGPRLQHRRGDTRLTVEALGIFRTGDRLAWERENLGHRLRAELRRGTDAGHVAIGARHLDEIDAVESWALSDSETGLTSLLFARDYRDYWNRFGGHGFVRVGGPHGAALTLSAGRELWSARDARRPWAMFPGGRAWRVNPTVPEGTATLLVLDGVVDTRNDPDRPLDGWWIRGQYEHGRFAIDRPGDTTRLDLTRPSLRYGRVFLDARRYNRIAPHASVNLRLVAGGLLHGDGLPAQRALSVSGVDALPGYRFRRPIDGVDVGTCTTLSLPAFTELGQPAGCDRILLLQAEWAGDFRIGLFGREPRTDDRRWYADGLRADGRWVVFVNSGRGWLVGRGDGALTYPALVFPGLAGFRSDAGVGLEFGTLGVYVTQPLNDRDRTPRAFVRLGRRF